MTAPDTAEAPTEQEDRDRFRRHHKLCVLQAYAGSLGMPRVTLCGKVLTGPRVPPTGHPPCPMCFEVLAEHRAACPACQDVGWGP